MNNKNFLILLVTVGLLGQGMPAAQEETREYEPSGEEAAPLDEQKEENEPAGEDTADSGEQTETEQENKDPGQFTASEEVLADQAVAFPTDI